MTRHSEDKQEMTSVLRAAAECDVTFLNSEEVYSQFSNEQYG